MKGLANLEMAILKDDSKSISDYVSEIDRKTSNEMMRRAGERFGFQTIDFQGTTWTHMGLISDILGYTNVSGVWKLVEKHQLMTSKIGWFFPEGKIKAREIFNLSKKDTHATFVTWDTILICGMCGKGEKSDMIKLYLLEAERAFRVGVAGETDIENAKSDLMHLKLVKEEISMMNMIDRMKDSHFKLVAIEALETLTGHKYPGPKQDLIEFSKKAQ